MWPAAMAMLACLIYGCGGGAESDRPNLVLVTIDTLRADHCSCYGYERQTTPYLDHLAESGVLFDAAYAPTAVTGPTHATLFTGLYPFVHGVVRNGLVADDTRPTLAEVLRAEGYVTAGFVSSYVVSGRFGFARGFDHFDDDFEGAEPTFYAREWEGEKIEGQFDRRAADTNARVLDWLATTVRQKPFFLWVHYFDPHQPYVPPPPYDSKFLDRNDPAPKQRDIARYDGEILYTDTELQRLVAAVERAAPADRTLLVVTSDHGEGLMDHGWPGHGPLLYEEDVRVPLLVRWPGRFRAGRVERPVALLDLMPTLLELFDVPQDEMFLQGRSLVPLLDGAQPGADAPPVYVQRRAYESKQLSQHAYATGDEQVSLEILGDKFAVRRGRWKYIEAREEATRELYDMELDPRERHDLSDERPQVVDELSRIIALWLTEQLDLATTLSQNISPEDLRRLRAIGYAP